LLLTEFPQIQKKADTMTSSSSVSVITIDGPAGSGKSTVAAMLARELGWTYVTTGAIYRTLGWMIASAGASVGNQTFVAQCVGRLESDFRQDTKTGQVFLSGENISDKIRTPEASEQASLVAQDAFVRSSLLPVQRRVVLDCRGAVVDGRDMGTVVFPEAPLKIFLTASPEERARRRREELVAKGETVDFAALVREIHARDERDANRAVAPMKPADDAINIDCTINTPNEVVALILAEARARGLAG
jgi:cytidylate kinase